MFKIKYFTIIFFKFVAQSVFSFSHFLTDLSFKKKCNIDKSGPRKVKKLKIFKNLATHKNFDTCV